MFTLYRHQEIALSYLRSNDCYSLLMEAGTGKTLTVLTRVSELLKRGAISNYLIVAPKSALGSWIRDIEKFNDLERMILTDNGTFINYDRIWRNGFDTNIFDLVVLDESHCIKNRTSNRTKSAFELALNAKYRYILTGTVISNGALEDIFAQFCFLDPYKDKGRIYSRIFKNHLERMSPGKTFRGSYYEFLDRYAILNKYHKPYKYINVRELQALINEHSYRVKKSECLDLPDKLPDEIIYVENKEKALYKRLHSSSALLEYEILAENPLSRMVKLRQLSSGFIKNENELLTFKCEKLEILRELIERYDTDKKLVIFAEFKFSIASICELLNTLKIKYVTLDGEQKNKTIWRDFQKDESIRVIVCQYQTANAGIDLFASDTIIYYEPTLRSTILEQSRDRIHRSGQKNKCSYIHLLTKGTVEEAIYKALSGYADFSEKLFTEYLATYQKSYNK